MQGEVVQGTDVLIALDNVTKTFPPPRGLARGKRPVRAVRGVTLELRRGAALGVAGESGSGKSTIARMIGGLETPTTGDVVINGEPMPRHLTGAYRASHARLVQMVFQDPYMSLDPHQSVEDVLDEVQRVHFRRDRAERKQRTAELLDSVGLAARYLRALPRQLSGGQRQRLAIARALAAEPEVLILDEAVSALDVSVQAQVLNLLSQLRREFGLTYLFISHDLSVISHIADEVAVLYRGRVMEQGPVDAVLASPQHPYSQLLLSSLPRPGMEIARRAALSRPLDEGGCLFRERCPVAVEACATEPDLLRVTLPAGAAARCWLTQAGR